MTGLPADRTHFDGSKMVTNAEKDDLWDNLVTAKENGTMMGCSAEGGLEAHIQYHGEDSGIMSGHAYSIIDVFELKDTTCKNYHKSHRLLMLRNPWGHGEWTLKWSEDKNHSEKMDKFYT